LQNNIVEENMEKKSLLIFLIPIILIPIAIIIPAIGLGNLVNSFSYVHTEIIIPAIGLGNLEGSIIEMQCYGYYGC
jgi:hypothetical protein